MNNNEHRDCVDRIVAAIYEWDRIVSRAITIIEEIDKVISKKVEERTK